MKKKLALLFIIALCFMTVACSSENIPNDNIINNNIPDEALQEVFKLQEDTPITARSNSTLYKVINVVDGDTLDIDLNGKTRVRLIGVDTPESVHPDAGKNIPYGSISSAYTESKLLNQQVTIELDVQENDRYGRLLAYVWLGDEMFNKTLLDEGHAKVATYPPNVKYVDTFVAAEREAQSKGIGIWSYDKSEQLQPNDNSTQLQPPDSDGSYIGNKNSKIFHHSYCPSVGKTKDYNKVYLNTRAEATNGGFVPCKNCNP